MKIAPSEHLDKDFDEIDDDLSDDDNSKKLEDVRMSNFAYS